MNPEDEELLMNYLNHKHCPVCGRVIESEDTEAYYHIFMPTRCLKPLEETQL